MGLFDWAGGSGYAANPTWDYANTAMPTDPNYWDISGGATSPDIAASSQAINLPESGGITAADVTGPNTWDVSGDGSPAWVGKLGSALKDLQGSGLGSSGSGASQAGGLNLQTPQAAQSQVQRGGGGLQTLASLIQQHMALRNALMNSATGVSGSGQPVNAGNQRTSLLGNI